YWTVETDMKTATGEPFVARLVALDGKKLGKFDIPNEKTASEIVSRIKASRFSVSSVESKPARRNPNPPFTTSTLQQEASRKLGFSAYLSMQVAQRLYGDVEIAGEPTAHNSDMRTDGVQTAAGAVAQARTVINIEVGEA